jgi:hypothetical protein
VVSQPATTTTLGSPASTAPGATATSTPTTTILPAKRVLPSVIGLAYSDAEKFLEDLGWKVTAMPARVASTTSYPIVGQRQNDKDTVSLIVADTATCDKDQAKWTYCDGRPVAHFKWADAAGVNGTTVKVGSKLVLTDVSGNVVSRRWRWIQGTSNGGFSETSPVLTFTVAEPSGTTLSVTLEATNSKATDSYTYTWTVV